MNKDEVKKLIENNPKLMDFIKGDKACFYQAVGGIDVVIYKETSANVSFYYRCPYSHSANYNLVSSYMEHAIPILKELLKKKDEDNLMTSNCIR